MDANSALGLVRKPPLRQMLHGNRGIEVGAGVGTGVGTAVGLAVGRGVGVEVGTGVGQGVGRGVGTGVGSLVRQRMKLKQRSVYYYGIVFSLEYMAL